MNEHRILKLFNKVILYYPTQKLCTDIGFAVFLEILGKQPGVRRWY